MGRMDQRCKRFRASIVLENAWQRRVTRGGEQPIKQMISKGFALYLYDYKFDDLSVVPITELLKH